MSFFQGSQSIIIIDRWLLFLHKITKCWANSGSSTTPVKRSTSKKGKSSSGSGPLLKPPTLWRTFRSLWPTRKHSSRSILSRSTKPVRMNSTILPSTIQRLLIFWNGWQRPTKITKFRTSLYQSRRRKEISTTRKNYCLSKRTKSRILR